jgi:hypothetical protein
LNGTRKTSAHCFAARGSCSATKEKKLRSAAKRQLRVFMVAAALLLDVLEECQHLGTREVFQAESRYCLVLALSDESEKQAPGIAIRQYRPMRSVALFN